VPKVHPIVVMLLALGLPLAAGAADPPPPAPVALSEESDRLAAARKLLPAFSLSSTAHYVLLTDAPKDSAAKVLDLLETTHDAFHADCRRLKFEPEPLRHKLVAILFTDKAAYTAFAKTSDRMDRKWAAGYYNPSADRLVIYDLYSSPEVQQNLKLLRNNELKITQGAPANKKSEMLQKNRAERRRLIGQAEDSFMATVAHEAAHQLFFHTGIQSPGKPYPLWLAEGLATVFEVEEADDDSVGFFADNARHLAAKRAATVADRLVPLRALVTSDMLGAGADAASGGDMKDFYSQAHVLTSWIARHRPTELRLYLEALKAGVHGDPRKRQPVFESIFGPVAAMERVWLRAEARRWAELWNTPAGRKLRAYDEQGAVTAQEKPADEGLEADAEETPEPQADPAEAPAPEPPASPSAP
jgi:hypothetical protein